MVVKCNCKQPCECYITDAQWLTRVLRQQLQRNHTLQRFAQPRLSVERPPSPPRSPVERSSSPLPIVFPGYGQPFPTPERLSITIRSPPVVFEYNHRPGPGHRVQVQVEVSVKQEPSEPSRPRGLKITFEQPGKKKNGGNKRRGKGRHTELPSQQPGEPAGLVRRGHSGRNQLHQTADRGAGIEKAPLRKVRK